MQRQNSVTAQDEAWGPMPSPTECLYKGELEIQGYFDKASVCVCVCACAYTQHFSAVSAKMREKMSVCLSVCLPV